MVGVLLLPPLLVLRIHKALDVEPHLPSLNYISYALTC